MQMFLDLVRPVAAYVPSDYHTIAALIVIAVTIWLLGRFNSALYDMAFTNAWTGGGVTTLIVATYLPVAFAAATGGTVVYFVSEGFLVAALIGFAPIAVITLIGTALALIGLVMNIIANWRFERQMRAQH